MRNIRIDGFYDDVAPPSAQDEALLETLAKTFDPETGGDAHHRGAAHRHVQDVASRFTPARFGSEADAIASALFFIQARISARAAVLDALADLRRTAG